MSTHTAKRSVFIVPALGIALGSLFSACADAENHIKWDDPPATTSGSGGGDADAGDAGDDADAGPTTDGGDCDCEIAQNGECIPLSPLDFSAPLLVWIGLEGEEAPPCPAQAPVEQAFLHGDPTVPSSSCASCSCLPSQGACELPQTITAHAALCSAAEGAPETPTNPPEVWDGACSAENAIPAGLSCGPGKPCVQSVTTNPLVVTDDQCFALPSTQEPLPAASWGRQAKVCDGSAFGKCPADEQCAPAPTSGFRRCVEMSGIHECPAVGYSEPFVLYEDFDDSRVCTPCSCGKPQGSYCMASIAFFATSECSSPVVSGNLWSLSPTCLDVTPYGQAIGSKSATEPVYFPGVCQASGGELLGDVLPANPRTFCCLP